MVILLWIICPFQEVFTIAWKSYTTEQIIGLLRQAEVQALPGEGRSGHREINVELGDPSYPGTAVVERWLRSVP